MQPAKSNQPNKKPQTTKKDHLSLLAFLSQDNLLAATSTTCNLIVRQNPLEIEYRIRGKNPLTNKCDGIYYLVTCTLKSSLLWSGRLKCSATRCPCSPLKERIFAPFPHELIYKVETRYFEVK